MKKEKQKPHYSILQVILFMIRTAWRERKSVLFINFLLVCTTVISRLLNLYVAPSVLRYVETAASLSELLTGILLFAVGIIVVGAVHSYLSENTMAGGCEVRMALFEMLNLKVGRTSYVNATNPDFLKKKGEAEEGLWSSEASGQAIWVTLVNLSSAIICFAVYLFILKELNLFLIVLTIVTSFIGYQIEQCCNRWSLANRSERSGYFRKVYYCQGRANDRRLAKDIRIFHLQPWLEQVYQSALKKFEAFRKREEGRYGRGDVWKAFLVLVRNGAAYAYLIWIALDGGLGASEFLLYFSTISGFTSWVVEILAEVTVLHKENMDLSALMELLEYPEPFVFEEGKPLEPDLNQTYEITLRDVSFRYPGAEKDTLSHLNLTIHSEESIAVVGLNGAGKTTLVKLICGLFDPTEGEVLLNGEDIRQYNRRDYYRHFSAVFQKTSVLAGTIAQNVAQEDEIMDEEKVIQCIERAGLGEKMAALPKGIQTFLVRDVYDDAVELSGGEMQRMMLARALYKNSPMIVLDEPTAALDPIAESNLYQKYQELMKNRVSVFISHRLASTRFCDRILLLGDGTIMEEGTHESLLNMGGRYAELFEVQSRYYKEGGAENEDESMGI